jgi:hypothetical protein
MNRRGLLKTAAAVGGASLIAGTAIVVSRDENGEGINFASPFASKTLDPMAHLKLDTSAGHDRTIVYDLDHKKIATLTEGARMVVFEGKARTFTEPDNTKAQVISNTYVRIAPKAWFTGAHTEKWFYMWFFKMLTTKDDDILGIAMQYLDGTPIKRDKDDVPYAGDAGFGLVRTSDTVDGADFYDYLGIPWKWQDGTVSRPSSRWYRKVDCSGYLRLVYGYRGGIETFRENTYVDGLPRTAFAMATLAPSVLIAKGSTPSKSPSDSDLVHLLPGDAVFFALHKDPDFISHSGVYMGDDTRGHMRFVSSRTSINGPTFGDFTTKSIFDEGFFRSRLRRVVRF